MPMYKYYCTTCGHEETHIKRMAKFDSKELLECSDCENVTMTFRIPSTTNSLIMELRDSYRGKHLRKNNEQKMKQRMHDHAVKSGEYRDKIDKYGLDDGIRKGWTKKANEKS